MYDVAGTASDRTVVILNDVHIDIMDYIAPATCTDAEFRIMWQVGGWGGGEDGRVYSKERYTKVFDE